MIKCSICSYQCDNWYVSNWRLACHIYFSMGRSPLELAQGLSRVALALHIAGRSTPFGVTWSRLLTISSSVWRLPIRIFGIFAHAMIFSQKQSGSSYANVSTVQVATTYLFGCDRRYAYTTWSVPRRVRWYYSGLQTPSKLWACSLLQALLVFRHVEFERAIFHESRIFEFQKAGISEVSLLRYSDFRNSQASISAGRLAFTNTTSDLASRICTRKKLFTLLDLCVSSLRRGHANLLCIVPILTDDPRRESERGYTKTLRRSSREQTRRINDRVTTNVTNGTTSTRQQYGRVQKIVYTSRFVRVILAQGPC